MSQFCHSFVWSRLLLLCFASAKVRSDPPSSCTVACQPRSIVPRYLLSSDASSELGPCWGLVPTRRTTKRSTARMPCDTVKGKAVITAARKKSNENKNGQDEIPFYENILHRYKRSERKHSLSCSISYCKQTDCARFLTEGDNKRLTLNPGFRFEGHNSSPTM